MFGHGAALGSRNCVVSSVMAMWLVCLNYMKTGHSTCRTNHASTRKIPSEKYAPDTTHSMLPSSNLIFATIGSPPNSSATISLKCSPCCKVQSQGNTNHSNSVAAVCNWRCLNHHASTRSLVEHKGCLRRSAQNMAWHVEGP